MAKHGFDRSRSHTTRFEIDPEGIAATRGLLIGLVLSQVFWVALAFLVF